MHIATGYNCLKQETPSYFTHLGSIDSLYLPPKEIHADLYPAPLTGLTIHPASPSVASDQPHASSP